MSQAPIVIIGAGIGGLSAAIRLAVAGKRVIVLEKNAKTGGKMGQVEEQGFRWDTGPSVITMRHVFEDLFTAAGERFEDYVELLPIEPLARYFYPDGLILDASGNLAQMTNTINRLNPKDVEGYLAYLSYAARIHRITGPVFIYNRPPSPASFRRVPVNEWLKVDPFRSMYGAIKGYVTDSHLRQMLSRFATYVGGNPYSAPATLNVIAHVELTGGVSYPRGGIYKIAEAMTQLAAELGVDIRTDISVTKIELREGKVSAVVTENESIEVSAVITNLDVTTTYKYLLPQIPSITKRLTQLEKFAPSCSGYIMLLGVEGNYPGLSHHNIFFSADYQAEFHQIFAKQRLPDDPTIYIAITSKSDSYHAPEGCENWFILVNAPPIPNQANLEGYREIILNKLAAFGYDVRDKIRVEKVFTALDLQNQTGAWRGALYGPSPNSPWTAFRRLHNRSKEVTGLYFAGGTTHPGGGVPMVTLSGKVAAEMVLEDLS